MTGLTGMCGGGAMAMGEQIACWANAARDAAMQPVMGVTLLIAGAVVALAAVYWVQNRLRRMAFGVGRTVRLAFSRQGRVLLGHARRARARAERVTSLLHQELENKSERRALQSLLRQFIRDDLEHALNQGMALLSLSDDREALRLKTLLEQQISQWNQLPDGRAREKLLAETATTRHRLARLQKLNEDRHDISQRLEEIADSLRMLEEELTGLRGARNQDLPRINRHLRDTAEQLHHLRQAYKELDGAPER